MPKKTQRGAAKTDRPEQSTDLKNLSWDDIRIFLACTKESSFRRAADKLKISSSTVVRRIDHLEKTLGVSLFNRLPEGIILTDNALAIKDSAQEMERSLFELVHKRNQSDVSTKGLVKISITEGLGIYWLMPRLVEFQHHHPNLILDVQCAMQNADVLRLEADIAIQFERPTNPDLIIAKIGTLHIYPFASEEYLALHGKPTTLAEAKDHRFIQQISSQIDEKAWAHALGLPNIDNIVGIRSNSSAALFYAIERGGGIGALPTYAVALNAPVIPVDIAIHHSRDIWLTYHSSIRNIPRKSIVVDWIRSIFDPQVFPWFRDEFIHPNKLVEMMPGEAKSNINENYFSVTPFTVKSDGT